MLRRFEMYPLAADAPPGAGEELAAVLRACPRFIPEVLDSAVGWNRSGNEIDLVWEHAYQSPESYQRYMCHPYHACVLDRYLLYDSPGRVTGDSRLALGLLGYAIPGPRYRRAGGVRRVLALRVRADAGAPEVEALLARLRDAPSQAPELALSLAEENSMGLEWSPAWTHLWEQAFDDEAALERYLAGPSPLAAAERAGFDHPDLAALEAFAAVHYEIEAG